MAKTSRILLLTSLVALSSLSSLLANPMQDALKSVHCVRRGIKFKVSVTGCQEREVAVNSCLGTCLSFSTPTGDDYKQVQSCLCCQQVKTKTIHVGLWCQDKNDATKLVEYFHPIETAITCGCTSCWRCWAQVLPYVKKSKDFYKLNFKYDYLFNFLSAEIGSLVWYSKGILWLSRNAIVSSRQTTNMPDSTLYIR